MERVTIKMFDIEDVLLVEETLFIGTFKSKQFVKDHLLYLINFIADDYDVVE